MGKSGVLHHKSGNISDKAHCVVIFAIAQLSRNSDVFVTKLIAANDVIQWRNKPRQPAHDAIGCNTLLYEYFRASNSVILFVLF